MLDDFEKLLVDSYQNGKIIKLEYNTVVDRKNILTPDASGWPRPLEFCDVPLKYDKNTFKVRVPGRGVDIAYVTYE